jgi:hypothetical protein
MRFWVFAAGGLSLALGGGLSLMGTAKPGKK